MNRTVAIVQARVGSSRLPGKVLKRLKQRTVLAEVLERVAAIPGVSSVVCATSLEMEDDPVALEASNVGAEVFRGSLLDVLARYRGAALSAQADVIVRVTSDCPLIDPTVCGAVIKLLEDADADYAANNLLRGFPHGLDCEAFTFQLLERAHHEAMAPEEREHVGPWMRSMEGIRRASLQGPGGDALKQRWTLDYPADFEFLSALFRELGDLQVFPHWRCIMHMVEVVPELSALQDRCRVSADLEVPDVQVIATRKYEDA